MEYNEIEVPITVATISQFFRFLQLTQKINQINGHSSFHHSKSSCTTIALFCYPRKTGVSSSQAVDSTERDRNKED
jgi:uncharacterized protein (DUF779 family)